MDSRVDEIDVAKGIGIFLVVLGHIVPENTYLRAIIYSFHMPLFFFLNGLVAKKQYSFNQNKTERKNNFIKSNSKLIACYLFYSFVFILFDIVFSSLLNRSWKWDIINTVTLFGINVLWFITAIIIAKNLGSVIINRINKKRIILVISIFLFLLVNSLSIVIVRPSHGAGRIIVNAIVAVSRGVLGCSFWLLGYCLKEKVISLFHKLDVTKCALISTMLMLVLMSLSYYNYSRGKVIDIHLLKIPFGSMLYLTSILGTFATLVFSRVLVLCKISSFAIFLGKNTLMIMIIHEYLVAKLLRGLSNYSAICSNLVNSYMVEFVIVFIITLLLCYILGPIDAKIIKSVQSFFNRL